MRKWAVWAIWVVLFGAIWGQLPSELFGSSPLDGDKLIASLRPRHPVDRDFLSYIGALLQAGHLPHALVESTFLWAKDQPEYQARYFREGLIRRARAQGIQLPTGQAPLSGRVQGQVIYQMQIGLLRISIPVPNATVRLADRRTTTDPLGRFSFNQVPFGRYTLRAEGKVGLVSRTGTGQLRLPTPPPSTEPARLTIYVR